MGPKSTPTKTAHTATETGAQVIRAGGRDVVEIKYRAFIPSPAIVGPNSSYDMGPFVGGEDFGGDNRGFSYDQGTSRVEITATLTLDANSGISDLRTVSRHWGQSKAYDSTYTYHVAGKPDWWMDIQAGLEPSRWGTLAVSDDNLIIKQGASGSERSTQAVADRSAMVSILVSGALPLITSPSIDADISVYLRRRANGDIEARVWGEHDGFPCHELYVNGRRLFIYDPVSVGKDPGALLPPMDCEISTPWVSIPARAAATT